MYELVNKLSKNEKNYLFEIVNKTEIIETKEKIAINNLDINKLNKSEDLEENGHVNLGATIEY